MAAVSLRARPYLTMRMLNTSHVIDPWTIAGSIAARVETHGQRGSARTNPNETASNRATGFEPPREQLP